jgi:hypothetical protein
MHRSHPFFDNEALWAKENVPPPADLTFFQKRLDRLAGKTPDGLSKIRVVWGQDFETTKILACGEWRMRYAAWRWQDGASLREVGRPRFVVEQLHTRDELCRKDAWEDARYSWADGVRVDVLGPVPERGYYSELFTVAFHDSFCCDGREAVGGEPCLGGYREPNDADFERVARMIRRRDDAARSEALPTAEKVYRDADYARERAEERRRERIRERINDFVKTHSHTWVSHSDKLARHGRFQFVRGTSKSGLTEAERLKVLSGGSLTSKETNASSDTSAN